MYSKQIDAYAEIMQVFDDLLSAIINATGKVKDGKKLEGSEAEALIKKAEVAGNIWSKWRGIVHSEVQTCFDVYWDTVWVAVVDVVHNKEVDELEDGAMGLLGWHHMFIGEIREALGVSPLHKESRHLIYSKPLTS